MLYSAWYIDPLPNDPYRPTHKNHPVSIWVRADPKHYNWTLQLAFALVGEYYKRYGKIHACCAHLERLQELGTPEHLCKETYTPPPNKRAYEGLPKGISYFDCAINDQYFESCAVYTNGRLNVVETYRKYYHCKEWEMKWRSGGKPDWFKKPQATKLFF